MAKDDRMKSLIRGLLFPPIIMAALFGSSGRWDQPFAWGYVAVLVISALVGYFLISPDLRRERARPGPGDKDRLSRFVFLPLLLAHWVMAGADTGRLHWSDTVPFALRVVGLVGLVTSLGLSTWAARVNPFFSSAVRIQSERGHHLITAGPYQYVRHPSYAATLLCLPFGGLALGSWWAMLPLGGWVPLIIRRTLIEDRFLQRKLEGYTQYVRNVRYRLLPGIW